MDEVTKMIQEKLQWCMLFADGIVLIGENRKKIIQRLDV